MDRSLGEKLPPHIKKAVTQQTRKIRVWKKVEEIIGSPSIGFNVLIESMSDGVVLIDTEWKILRANKWFTDIFGYGKGEIEGLRIDDLISLPWKEDEALRFTENASQWEKIDEDLVRKTKDGSHIRVWLKTFPLIIKWHQIWSFWIYRDITKRLQAEKVSRELEDLKKAGQVLAWFAHHWKNDLQVILAHVHHAINLMAFGIPDDTNEIMTDLLSILTAATDSSESIKRLMYSATTESTENYISLNLNEIVGEVILLTEIQNKEKNISVKQDFKNIPCIDGDACELRDMVLNLINNSSDAIWEDGIIYIRTDTTEDGDIILEIKDTGDGMPEEVQAHIFEPYFTTKWPTWTGLWMPTVLRTVENHGGKIQIDSTIGIGTKIQIRFPQGKKIKHDPVPEAKLEVEKKSRILLVDDDSSIRDMCKSALEIEWFEHTDTANGPSQALRLLEKDSSYHLVITDVNMWWSISGWQLANIIKDRFGDSIYVAILTADGEHLQKEETICKADYLLQKPMSMRDFIKFVKQATQITT